MIVKNNIIAKCFKQSSNIDEENNQIIDINKRILQCCLKSSIIRLWLCTIGYKERLKLLNDLEKTFYILKKHNSRIKISLFVDHFVSNLENQLSEAVAANTYALLHCLPLFDKLCKFIQYSE